MKHTLTLLTLALCTIVASVRINDIHANRVAEEYTAQMHKPFLHTTVDLEDGAFIFKRLPVNASSMYLLDEQGRVTTIHTVSRRNNKIQVKQLHPGLYTVVLKQDNKTKMYSCHTDVVVKAAKRRA